MVNCSALRQDSADQHHHHKTENENHDRHSGGIDAEAEKNDLLDSSPISAVELLNGAVMLVMRVFAALFMPFNNAGQ